MGMKAQLKVVEAECRRMQREGLLQWVRDRIGRVGWKPTQRGGELAVNVYDSRPNRNCETVRPIRPPALTAVVEMGREPRRAD